MYVLEITINSLPKRKTDLNEFVNGIVTAISEHKHMIHSSSGIQFEDENEVIRWKFRKLDEFERQHMRVKASAAETDSSSIEKAGLRSKLDAINEKNREFEWVSQEATRAKGGLREEMADLEDQLWKLRFRKNELDIQN